MNSKRTKTGAKSMWSSLREIRQHIDSTGTWRINITKPEIGAEDHYWRLYEDKKSGRYLLQHIGPLPDAEFTRPRDVE